MPQLSTSHDVVGRENSDMVISPFSLCVQCLFHYLVGKDLLVYQVTAVSSQAASSELALSKHVPQGAISKLLKKYTLQSVILFAKFNYTSQ